MLKEKMLDALNEQLNFELYSAYIYFSMSAYFESINLKGFANWMRVQAMEELTHVKRFYDYIIDRGGRVKMSEIKAPANEWESPLAAFLNVLEHEQLVTSRINNLMDIALELRDHATSSFLKWFIDEQVEEEASVDEIVQSLKLNENNPGGLFLIDKELSQRTFMPPQDITI
ncbi:MAG: ferritin [Nitrospirae bacterium]|nr:ferritin [Nitrospirota bacterium]